MREAADGGLAAGIDEVGRGALAGPLCVACACMPYDPQVIGIDDSKKLSPKKREELSAKIHDVALGVGIAFVDPGFIDSNGMSKSLRKAMSESLASCLQDMEDRGNRAAVDAVLIDGNPVHIHDKEICIVKGDSKAASIACASIVAKVARDDLMRDLSKEHPEYFFDSNKGYGSAAHIAALKEVGPCPVHRRSFLNNILVEQQSLL